MASSINLASYMHFPQSQSNSRPLPQYKHYKHCKPIVLIISSHSPETRNISFHINHKIINMVTTPRLLSEITSNGEVAFPWKLHRVLEESDRLGFEDIVSWQGNRAFKVHDPKSFENTIMKKYFNQTRYKSFQRQRKLHMLFRLRNATCLLSCQLYLVNL